MSVDPAFRQFVHDAQETQRSEIAKKKMKNIGKCLINQSFYLRININIYYLHILFRQRKTTI